MMVKLDGLVCKGEEDDQWKSEKGGEEGEGDKGLFLDRLGCVRVFGEFM